MRFLGFAVVASALVLGACGGGDNAAAGDSAGASAAATPAAGASTGAAATPAGGAAMAPATGTVHEVKMVLEGTTYKFDPAEITIKAGDAIKWTMVSGGPHNVAFDPAQLGAAKAQIDANMPEKMAELQGKMLINPNETYTISFANVPAGTYDYVCTPHLAMNMRGKITVQ